MMTKKSLDIDFKYDPLVRVTLAGLRELELFPTEEDRKRAIAELVTSNQNIPRRHRNIVGSLGFAFVIFNLMCRDLLRRWTDWPDVANYVVSFFLIFAAAFFVRWTLDRKYLTRMLREKLISSGVPICVPCGYLLKGLPESTTNCPECGRNIDEETKRVIHDALQQSPLREQRDDLDSAK